MSVYFRTIPLSFLLFLREFSWAFRPMNAAFSCLLFQSGLQHQPLFVPDGLQRECACFERYPSTAVSAVGVSWHVAALKDENPTYH